tara:strand:+ start:349 stop:1248 length:900 start_codon:yes stop_codon:yes gene_type:complete
MSIGMLPPVDSPPVVTPTVDPNFASGFNYARSIAGGLPMEQVIAPGVSYSTEQPGGYTQAQLGPVITDTPTIVTDTPPDRPFSDIPPPNYSILPPNIIGGGMGDNVTIMEDPRRLPPLDRLKEQREQGFNFINQVDLDNFLQKIPPEELPPIPLEDRGFGPGIRRSEDFFIPEELMMPPSITTPPPVTPPPVTPPPVISKKMPPILLEDFGFGPGIRRSEDFFRPEELMMPELNIPESVTKKDINEALLQIDTPPVINTPDITQGLFNLQAPQVPILQTPQVSSGGRFLRQDMTPSLFR